METKVAIIGIFIADTESVDQVNLLLHEYGPYIIGRMGLPCRENNMNIISIILSADGDTISSLSGKLGRIKGVTTKAMQAKVPPKSE